MHRRTLAAATLALACIALTACTGTEGDPVSPSDQVTTTTTAAGPPQDVRIEFDELSLSLRVPARFGEGELGEREGDDCTGQEYTWSRLPSGSSDDSELLFIGTTSKGCPDNEPINGGFPTWASAADLPDDATPVDTPAGEGHRFSIDYTQCTNECYDREYDVVFVELPDKRSFWIQSSHVDEQTVDELVASLKVG